MIAVEQIARLAELFDRYNNALDPFSEDCRQAQQQFDALVDNLHTTHALETEVPGFPFRTGASVPRLFAKERP
jgi:hypothetical protein